MGSETHSSASGSQGSKNDQAGRSISTIRPPPPGRGAPQILGHLRVVQRHLGEQPLGGQRRAQLVRGIRGEPALALVPGRKPVQSVVGGVGQILQRVDLKNAVTTIRCQIVQLGWATGQGEPKTEAGERQVALDALTVIVLRDHRRRQDHERELAGDNWTDSGFEFTNQDGAALHPAEVTGVFEQIAYLAGLPPIRRARTSRSCTAAARPPARTAS